eukprot:822451-Rhodomonas_salina.1
MVPRVRSAMPVLRSRTLLPGGGGRLGVFQRRRKSGTTGRNQIPETAYLVQIALKGGSLHPISACIAEAALRLRACYAMSGTELALGCSTTTSCTGRKKANATLQ